MAKPVTPCGRNQATGNPAIFVTTQAQEEIIRDLVKTRKLKGYVANYQFSTEEERTTGMDMINAELDRREQQQGGPIWQS